MGILSIKREIKFVEWHEKFLKLGNIIK